MSIKTHATVVGAHVYLIVEDLAAGRRHVHTVYEIQLFGDKRAVIVGRELPLHVARSLIKRRAESDDTSIEASARPL